MSGFIGELNTGLNSTAMWGEVQNAAPLIITVGIFAFGYYVVKKVVKGAAKGKVRL